MFHLVSLLAKGNLPCKQKFLSCMHWLLAFMKSFAWLLCHIYSWFVYAPSRAYKTNQLHVNQAMQMTSLKAKSHASEKPSSQDKGTLLHKLNDLNAIPYVRSFIQYFSDNITQGRVFSRAMWKSINTCRILNITA